MLLPRPSVRVRLPELLAKLLTLLSGDGQKSCVWYAVGTSGTGGAWVSEKLLLMRWFDFDF